jgi:hypothetical protein
MANTDGDAQLIPTAKDKKKRPLLHLTRLSTSIVFQRLIVFTAYSSIGQFTTTSTTKEQLLRSTMPY